MGAFTPAWEGKNVCIKSCKTDLSRSTVRIVMFTGPCNDENSRKYHFILTFTDNMMRNACGAIPRTYPSVSHHRGFVHRAAPKMIITVSVLSCRLL